MTARMVIRREPGLLSVQVDGRTVASVSDTDVPGEPPLSPAGVAAVVAEDVARAMGADVEVVRP